MLAEYKKQTNIGIGFGLLLQIAGGVAPGAIGLILYIAGICVFLWGCVGYAIGKGHSGWWGALGLLWILGLIVLILFPDKHK